MKELSLTELIERLQNLSKKLGEHNSKMTNVRFHVDDEEYTITNAWIVQDPDYNFDEANCGPDEWIELYFI